MEHIIKLDTFDPNHSLIFQTNGITLFHINIRNIRKNFSLLELYLASSSTVFDVICVSETFLHIDEPFCFDIPGYSFICVSRQERGGGVGVYVRDGVGCRGGPGGCGWRGGVFGSSRCPILVKANPITRSLP